MLADGSLFEGRGLRRAGLSRRRGLLQHRYDRLSGNSPASYAGQIVAFTFPHIGIVGVNDEDIEFLTPVVRGLIVRADAENPSNYRSLATLDRWLKKHNIPAIAGIDTRALTSLIRQKGMPHGAIVNGAVHKRDMMKAAKDFAGLEGQDLAKDVSTRQTYKWNQTQWAWQSPSDNHGGGYANQDKPSWTAVVIDYGVKRNILRLLAGMGADIIVVPANSTTEDVLKHNPQGVLLSNGPGDPAATGEYAIPTIKGVVDSGVPVFGICLGHQMLSLALGAKTKKMAQGHHGANHPVKDMTTGKVEIVSMNHGFTVDATTLPKGVNETHISLFDGTNCGIAMDGKDVFSVQYHPEKPPEARMDLHYLFECFAAAAKKRV